ncbi:hypothetical protein AML17_10515 [Escherichia coli]|nr:hypothetical protein AML17_10515 [Escherichia coli]
MKNCWKILEIEETTDVDIIRRAYLALLSSFHPETDPQGFKQLRQAYEDALRIAQSPAKSVWQPEEHEVAEHEILLAFRALLSSDSERFLPSAWQRFIQQLNYCSMEDIDELRWSLCTIAMNTALNRPGFPGEYFICELRLPDHYFRWKHNKLFLLLPEEYGPAFPAIVDCYTSPPTFVWPVPLLSGFSSYYGVLPPLCKDH